MRTIGDMDGAPVGRRVFLGLAAFGVSGIVWGSKAAGFMERLLAPVSAKDGHQVSLLADLLVQQLPEGPQLYCCRGQVP